MRDPTLIVAADAVVPDLLRETFVAAFADYLIGPFDLPPARWPHFLRRQGVDLMLSRVAMVDGSVAAFALVAPRAEVKRWRLATMGAVPAARGLGAAPSLLDDMIDRAREHSIDGLELEVFAQNVRAVRLYRSRGFEVLHELHGYEGAGASDATPPATAKGTEIDLDSGLAWLDEAVARIGDVPLQATPASLSTAPDGLTAWRLGTAQMIVGVNAAGGAVIHSLLDLDPGQRDAEALVRALLRDSPGRGVVVPALQRPDLGGDALRRARLQAQPLHQYLMFRPAESRSSTAPSSALTRHR